MVITPNTNIADDQLISYEVMNASTDKTIEGFKKFYYCEPTNAKAKTVTTLPKYRDYVRVIISK